MHRSEFGKKGEYKKVVFKEDFKIIGRQIENKEIVFDNCTFKKQFVLKMIEGSFSKTQLHFKYCRFDDGVLIEGCQFDFLSFSHCEINYKNFNLISNIIKRALNINNTSGDKLYINGDYSNLILEKLEFKECILKDINQKYSLDESKVELLSNNISYVDFDVESLYSKVYVWNGTYDDFCLKGEYKMALTFGGVSCRELSFRNSIVKNRLDVSFGKYKSIFLDRSSFEDLVWINKNCRDNGSEEDLVIKGLTIHSCNFQENLEMGFSRIKILYLLDNNFKKLFKFQEIIDVEIAFEGINQGNVLIKKCSANITFMGINIGNIYVKDLKSFSILIDDYQNKGNLYFTSILEVNYFVIQNSLAGNMELLNTDVRKFKEIVISNSSIEQVSFSSYPFAVKSYSNSNPDKNYGAEYNSLSNLKSVYNQLKKVAKGKGNIDVANKYQSLEYKYLFYEKRLGFDKLLLLLNWVSNNHGRSWFRGVLFTLLVGLACFYKYYSFFENDFTTNELLKKYVIFISSFPKLELDKYSEMQKTWDISLTIWLSRIFISYGIYQTIAAFRKYGKT